MKALEIRENMINAKDEYSEEKYADSLHHINENIKEIKQHLLDDNMLVKNVPVALLWKISQISEISLIIRHKMIISN